MKNIKENRFIIFIFQIITMGILVFVDQITKAKAESIFIDKDITVIKNILSFTYVRNTGAAFGSFSDNSFLLGIVTAVVLLIGIVALLLNKIQGKIPCLCAVMIIAGGIGNVIDRFANKYVIDFIRADFVDFPVFNFADILVTCGVFIAIGYLIYDTVKDVKKQKNGDFNE